MKRDLSKVENDIIRTKRRIKEILYNDPDIIEILNDPGIDPECPSDAVGRNILSYIKIPGENGSTTAEVRNYICFDIRDVDILDQNSKKKEQWLVVNCFVHESNMTTPYNVDRHDLLAYLVEDLLNYRDFLGNGGQFQKKSDNPVIIDVQWHVREMRFRAIVPNLTKVGGRNPYESLRSKQA